MSIPLVVFAWSPLATGVVVLVVSLVVISLGVFVALRYVKDGPAPRAPKSVLAPEDAEITEAIDQLDRAFTEWATTGVVSSEVLEHADLVVRERFELAAKRSSTRDVTRLRPDEQASFFLVAIRAAALGHPRHAGWPIRSPIRPRVAEALAQRASGPRPGLAVYAALVPAALSVGALEVAVQSLGQLRAHPVLRAEVLGWVRDMLVSAPSQNRHDTVVRFLRVVGDKSASAGTLTDAQRHALRFAVLPSPAIDRRVSLADPRPPAVCRAYLREWYEVHDGPTARERLEFFARVGVRSAIRRGLAEVEALVEAPSPDPELERRRRLLAHDRVGYASHDALAFDLVRVIELARLAHAAGFLSERETWDRVLLATRELEARYDGFPAIASDYLRGHAFASPPGGERDLTELVTYLVRAPTSPWAPGAIAMG